MFMGSPCSLVIYARVHFLSLHYLAYITLKLLHSYKMLEGGVFVDSGSTVGLSSFQARDTKLERFLFMNQYTQRKLFEF